MTAADEGTDEVYSAAAAAAAAQVYAATLQHQQLLLQSGMLAAAAAAAADATATRCSDDGTAAAAAAREHDALAAAAAAIAEAGAAGAGEASNASPGVVAPVSKPQPAAVPAASRDSMFSTRSNSSKNLMVQLGDCPSLTLALALHQQQQLRRQQEEADAEEELQQQSSKYCLPNFPELQLFPPSSPPADSAGTGFACSPVRMAATGGAGDTAGPASPGCCSTGRLLQLQGSSSGSPPLSPLLLGAAGSSAAAGSAPQSGDILQLVQQLGCALGGVGPAIEFLKLCSGNPAALAAAVTAVATSARAS